jgi:iron complex transport system substrate-binding protein
MRRALPAILLSLGLALAGCGGAGSGGDSAARSSAAPSAAGFPVTVGDVTLDQRPTKIISLAPTATEMLFAIGAGSQVKAVDDQSNYPPEAPRSKLSGYTPNAEAIAAQNPDLVVISDDINKIKEQLTQLKIPVYQTAAAKTLDESYAELHALGLLTGHVGGADAQVRQEKDALAKLVAAVPKRDKPLRYFIEFSPDLYSATSKTFVGSVLAQLGLVNIADAADKAGTGFPQLSAESVINANPDLIFLADTKCCQQSAASLAKRAGWANVAAVHGGNVVPLDDDLASRWGPRIVQLAQAVADAVSKIPA